jgi:hypothetical protein
VFAGSVGWTEKKTETETNPTEGNRTIGCGCFVWESVWLLVALFWNIQELIKNQLQLIVTGLSTVYSVYNLYSQSNYGMYGLIKKWDKWVNERIILWVFIYPMAMHGPCVHVWHHLPDNRNLNN